MKPSLSLSLSLSLSHTHTHTHTRTHTQTHTHNTVILPQRTSCIPMQTSTSGQDPGQLPVNSPCAPLWMRDKICLTRAHAAQSFSPQAKLRAGGLCSGFNIYFVASVHWCHLNLCPLATGATTSNRGESLPEVDEEDASSDLHARLLVQVFTSRHSCPGTAHHQQCCYCRSIR
jgi:hypothetical protein